MRKAPRHQGNKATVKSNLRLMIDDLRLMCSTKPNRQSSIINRQWFHGFTLTEVMVSVLVLLAVIIATSKIFSTAGQVTGIGQATASVMQEAAAIERRLRADLNKLSREGFFAIRSVAVPNNIHASATPPGPLLNPNLPEDTYIRADQLVFFSTGVQSMQTFRIGDGSDHKGQGTVSRIYYGHAFQLPEAKPVEIGDGEVDAHDPTFGSYDFSPIRPWNRDPVDMVLTQFSSASGTGTDEFSTSEAAAITGVQPDARQWLLVRQPVALVDDDQNGNATDSKTVYMGQATTARSIFMDHINSYYDYGFTREVFTGRVDGAATLLNEIRQWVIDDNPIVGGQRPWADPFFPGVDQREVISSAVYYPRAERYPPSAHRVDQALTNHVISAACSSFIIDWTYENGVGRIFNDDGFIYDPDTTVAGDECWGIGIHNYANQFEHHEHPWFGMPHLTGAVMTSLDVEPDPVRGTAPLVAYEQNIGTTPQVFAWFVDPPIHAFNIDDVPFLDGDGVYWYEAIFGYNQNRPLDDFGYPDSFPGPFSTRTPGDLGFTPWPSAIRITMTLHDPAGKLEFGRTFQFVIDLPKPEVNKP